MFAGVGWKSLNGSAICAQGYGYNPYGQRIRKETAEGTTWYLYNEQGLAAEYDNAGNLLVEYHYTPQSPWMTNPILQKRDGQISYYENDHLGTPQKLVTSSGRVVWEARYRAFGEVEVITNEVENPLRFPGQYYDAETELHQNFHRDYNPALGRYVEADPIGMWGGLNSYGYVLGNPVSNIDLYGFYTEKQCNTDPDCVWDCVQNYPGIGLATLGAIGGPASNLKMPGDKRKLLGGSGKSPFTSLDRRMKRFGNPRGGLKTPRGSMGRMKPVGTFGTGVAITGAFAAGYFLGAWISCSVECEK